MAKNPLIQPVEPLSLPGSVWLRQLFIHPAIDAETAPKSLYFKKRLKKVFLETYEFDGYDVSKNTFITAEGDAQAHEYLSDQITVGLLATSFFGLPNRAEDSDAGAPVLTWKQFGKNIVGGWKSHDKGLSTAQSRSQKLALFTVKPVIALFKVVGVLLKTTLNIVKLFTEYLPALVWSLTANGLGALVRKKQSIAGDGLQRKGLAILLGLPILLLSLVYIMAGMALLIGRAFTAPAKSVKLAVVYGLALNLVGEGLSTSYGRNAASFSASLIAVVGALASIALTMVLWGIALPLIMGVAVAVAPGVVPLVAWLSALPWVASSLAFAAGSLTVIGTLAVSFAPLVAGLAASMGLQISAATLATGITFGLMLPAIVVVSSYVADRFSNAWALWRGPNAKLFALLVTDAKATAINVEQHSLLGEFAADTARFEPKEDASQGVRNIVATSMSDLAQALDDSGILGDPSESFLSGSDSDNDNSETTPQVVQSGALDNIVSEEYRP